MEVRSESFPSQTGKEICLCPCPQKWGQKGIVSEKHLQNINFSHRA